MIVFRRQEIVELSHIIAPCDLHGGFAGSTARERFVPLMKSELWFSAKVDTPVLRASRPSLVRVLISSRSNSACPAKIVSINRPCAVVVRSAYREGTRADRFVTGIL